MVGSSRQHSSYGFHKMRENSCLADWVDCTPLCEDNYALIHVFVSQETITGETRAGY